MAMFPMTLGDPNSQTTPIFAFFVAFHIFVVSKYRDYIFGAQVDHSQSQPTDNKPSLRGAWVPHMKRSYRATLC